MVLAGKAVEELEQVFAHQRGLVRVEAAERLVPTFSAFLKALLKSAAGCVDEDDGGFGCRFREPAFLHAFVRLKRAAIDNGS